MKLEQAQIEDDLGPYFDAKANGRGVPHEYVYPFASAKRLLTADHGTPARSFEVLAGGKWPGQADFVGAFPMLQAAAKLGHKRTLDYIILEEACRRAREHANRLGHTKPNHTKRFSWNASADLLEDAAFVTRYLDTLKAHGIDATRVGVEILEEPEITQGVIDVRIQLVRCAGSDVIIDDLWEGQSGENLIVVADIMARGSKEMGRPLDVNGFKFGKDVRDGLVKGTDQDRLKVSTRLTKLMAGATQKMRVLTFERGGDTPAEWAETQAAITAAVPDHIKEDHVILIQGGPRMPIDQMLPLSAS